MQLYSREKQLTLLDNIFDSVNDGSNFIVISGKKKVGKSTMISEYFRQRRGVYVSLNTRPTRVQLKEVNSLLKGLHLSDVPDFSTWQDVLRYVFFTGKDIPVNLAFDDIHHLECLEPEFLTQLPSLWEKYAGSSMLNFVGITDSRDFYNKYFANPAGPLHGIPIKNINVTPFSFTDVARIMQLNDSILPLQEIVKTYLIFGGLPKYYALFEQFNLWNANISEVLKELVFRRFAPLYFDMKEMLYRDFRSAHSQHFNVLRALAAGHMTLNSISGAAGMNPTSVMKYLHELQTAKELVKRKEPFSAADLRVNRAGRYFIANYFENFWFRFIQPDIISYELGHYTPLMQQTMEALPAYVQIRMKHLIRELLAEFQNHPFVRGLINFIPDAIGESWTRENTADIAARSDAERKALLGAVLHSPLQYSLQGMREFNARMLDTGRLFPGHRLDHLIVGWENPGFSFSDLLAKSGTKHLLVHDLLALVPYRSRALRALRSKAERVRIIEPVATRLVANRVRESQ